MNVLETIQQKLKSPKSEYNEFGGFSYRTKEKIIELLKPLLAETKSWLVFEDDLVELGGHTYAKSNVVLRHEEAEHTLRYIATGFARHANELPKMQVAQVTGATFSYAQKAALDALFLLSDPNDLDAKKPEAKVPKTQDRPPVASGKATPWLNIGTKEYTDSLSKLKSKQITLDELKKTYRLSKATESKILTDSK